ncbi:hypothetical protein [Lysinibacillus sphaericus]|uniref:hypothetical protein n=1 Tax=Lysinibacillus sphaericus TaxID=1421 RepID=UPI003D74DE1E
MSYYQLFSNYGRDVYFSYTEKNEYDQSDLRKGLVYPLDEKLHYSIDKFDPYLNEYDILPTIGGYW